jgi:hypothetical protein
MYPGAGGGGGGAQANPAMAVYQPPGNSPLLAADAAFDMAPPVPAYLDWIQGRTYELPSLDFNHLKVAIRYTAKNPLWILFFWIAVFVMVLGCIVVPLAAPLFMGLYFMIYNMTAIDMPAPRFSDLFAFFNGRFLASWGFFLIYGILSILFFVPFYVVELTSGILQFILGGNPPHPNIPHYFALVVAVLVILWLFAYIMILKMSWAPWIFASHNVFAHPLGNSVRLESIGVFDAITASRYATSGHLIGTIIWQFAIAMIPYAGVSMLSMKFPVLHLLGLLYAPFVLLIQGAAARDIIGTRAPEAGVLTF